VRWPGVKVKEASLFAFTGRESEAEFIFWFVSSQL
jgi:hypothetical protein